MQKQVTYLLSLFLVAGLTLSACATATQPGVNVSPTNTPVIESAASLTGTMTDTAITEPMTTTDEVTPG